MRASVVVPTHNRPERLTRQLRALIGQDLPPSEFEVIVVDDGSRADTARAIELVLAEASGPEIRVVRNDTALGRAGARNAGWRAARAALVAFSDDDCEATPGWLRAMIAAAESDESSFVQGPVTPNPADGDPHDGFRHTIRVDRLGPWFETANMLYRRSTLERLGGFDEETFRKYGGEDTDLAWRAIAIGARPLWAADGLVHHAIVDIGWRGMLRQAWRWDQTMILFRLYPHLRSELRYGLFYLPTHAPFYLFLAGAVMPGLPRTARGALRAGYMWHLYAGRRTPVLAPLRVAVDCIEAAACLRGSMRYRVLAL